MPNFTAFPIPYRTFSETGVVPLGWLNVKDYGAVGNARAVYDGAITSGTDDFSSATAAFTPTDVNENITVRGAGASGADLYTTILAFVSSTAVTLATNASTTVSGADCVFGTDDTAAIQAAIDDAAALGAATIFFPDGTYYVNGSPQGVSRPSVLRIPAIDGDETIASIEFTGSTPTSFYGAGPISLGTDNQPFQGATIISMGDTGAVFGAEPGTVGISNFNSSQLVFRNLTIRTKDNPTRTAIDAKICCQLEVFDCMVDTGKYGPAVTEPSTAGVSGIITPVLFNLAKVFLDRVCVTGYYDGYVFDELASADNITAYYCKRGFVFNGTITMHAIKMGNLFDIGCEQGIVGEGSGSSPVRVDFLNYNAERSVSGWSTRQYDIAGTTLLGDMTYHFTESGVGSQKTVPLIQSGAADYLSMDIFGHRQVAKFITGGAQSIASGGFVSVNWTSDFIGDNLCTWASSPNPEKIRIDSPGQYHIAISVAFEANSTGYRQVGLIDDVSFATIAVGPTVAAVSGVETVATLSESFWFKAGTNITIQALQNSGGNLIIKDLGGQHYATQVRIVKVG